MHHVVYISTTHIRTTRFVSTANEQKQKAPGLRPGDPHDAVVGLFLQSSA